MAFGACSLTQFAMSKRQLLNNCTLTLLVMGIQAYYRLVEFLLAVQMLSIVYAVSEVSTCVELRTVSCVALAILLIAILLLASLHKMMYFFLDVPVITIHIVKVDS